MRVSRKRAFAPVLALLVSAGDCTPHSSGDVTPENGAGARSEAERGAVATDGFQLRYVIEGTGKPAIVVGSSVYLPRAFSRNLRQHLRMVFLDQRGYALSPGSRDASAFSTDKILADIESAELQIQPDSPEMIVAGNVQGDLNDRRPARDPSKEANA